ncbi:hypothetical protein LTR91_001576 [Friedmanniomyces endolithicus]|uniref:ER-bound oxygenase mpaB/mpaB'/Rubber oxygenase catalytic domain-containing protein n=1 Tax=Friedmanniomyces endolithicus TaxID=329885 RepID=A0AAN6R1D2_9PEZI|nr:hypothetical protein LTR57_011575 [Friedmanniomyces endolithicus]KAK0981056.1 hypothetical protein LTS01_011808 [Friedmanniomyces endolithicus]KAK1013264.1 hypothetical protein LTR91_001576 [Friedmanniomyces endolithicus]
MAWPNPFRRHTPQTRSIWGYTFELTDAHLTPEQCEPLKQSYDVLGEQVLARLNELSPPPERDLPRGGSQFSVPEGKNEVPLKIEVEGEAGEKQNDDPPTPPKNLPRDLYAILRDHAETDELLQRFWREVTATPDWVDWEQIQRGQDVFYRYGAANLTGLAYQSLLGGMGAARVVETLARTGGFSTKVARSRLFEYIAVHQEPGECAARWRWLRVDDTGAIAACCAWGIPINDLDSMATINTFSATLIWMSLPRQGIFLRQQEITDYMALWRYIGHVIGCPTDEFATPAQSRRLMESLLYYEVHPSETSKILANNIIKSLEGQPPGYASADFLTASARWLNGNALCDELGLMRPSLYYWALMAGQCLFFCIFNYSYRAVPSWDRHHIDMLKKAFYTIIVHTKYGLKGEESTFDFKYVPEYSTITEMGECMEEKATHSDVERRNLKTFVIAVGVVAVGTWVGVKVVSGIVRRIW